MKTLIAMIVAIYDQNPEIGDCHAAVLLAGQAGVTFQEALKAVEEYNHVRI